MMGDRFLEIWYGDILPAESEQQDYYVLLNDKEKEKASTFLRPELQKKYIKTRGVLRKVLGTYLNINPQKISIKMGEHGKPFVDDELFFNLSHTGNRFVIAVSNSSEVGIDLEQYKHRTNLQGLAEKCFSKEEQVYWKSLTEPQKVTMFYRFWVRKEAFVKAVGRGIALGLNQCTVDPQNQSRFISLPGEYGMADDWKIVEVMLGKEDVCAVVINNLEFNYKQTELK